VNNLPWGWALEIELWEQIKHKNQILWRWSIKTLKLEHWVGRQHEANKKHKGRPLSSLALNTCALELVPKPELKKKFSLVPVFMLLSNWTSNLVPITLDVKTRVRFPPGSWTSQLGSGCIQFENQDPVPVRFLRSGIRILSSYPAIRVPAQQWYKPSKKLHTVS